MNYLAQRIAASRLKKIAPDEFEFAMGLAAPSLSDYSQIKNIVDFVVSNGYELNGTNAPFIIGVVYRLFAPYKLYFDYLRTPTGMRNLIAKAMGYNSPEMISMHGNTLVAYYKGNWGQRVNEMADNFLKTTNKYRK